MSTLAFNYLVSWISKPIWSIEVGWRKETKPREEQRRTTKSDHTPTNSVLKVKTCACTTILSFRIGGIREPNIGPVEILVPPSRQLSNIRICICFCYTSNIELFIPVVGNVPMVWKANVVILLITKLQKDPSFKCFLCRVCAYRLCSSSWCFKKELKETSWNCLIKRNHHAEICEKSSTHSYHVIPRKDNSIAHFRICYTGMFIFDL